MPPGAGAIAHHIENLSRIAVAAERSRARWEQNVIRIECNLSRLARSKERILQVRTATDACSRMIRRIRERANTG